MPLVYLLGALEVTGFGCTGLWCSVLFVLFSVVAEF